MEIMNDLSSLNLNLLLSLEALLAEMNVTRAARRLGVTQPTMSRALRRLREELDDALLVRSGQGFVRTPRGERIHASLRDGLQALRRALQVPDFDLSTVQQTIVVAAQDVVGVFLIPALLRRMAEEAPGLSLDMVPLHSSDLAPQLEGGTLDLAIGVNFPDAPGLCRRLLFRDGWICLARPGHPSLKAGLDFEQYLSLSHALASPEGGGVGVVDRALAINGRQRKISYRSRYFIGAAMAVAQSDLLLTLPSLPGRELAGRLGLATYEPPLRLPTLEVVVLWHARLDLDPLHTWVRTALLAIVQNL